MAFADYTLDNTFKAYESPYNALNDVDLLVSQAADLLVQAHDLADNDGGKKAVDTLQALLKATLALLGMTGPNIDRLYELVKDGELSAQSRTSTGQQAATMQRQ